MNSKMIGLLAETSLHFGAGRNEGYIDLPVARESATGYPVLVGSSLKGSLRDQAEKQWDGRANGAEVPQVERVFGNPDGAGGIIVSDARLLLLPVRSLQSAYRWLTCPLIIERLNRDLARCGIAGSLPIPTVQDQQYLAAGTGPLYLEERDFTSGGGLPKGLVQGLSAFIGHADTAKRLETQLTILSNDRFQWFASYGLQVTARNKLKENKTSGNLWYEETLPPDTVLYAMLAERNVGNLLATAWSVFEDKPYLQAGGNETVGQGWLKVNEVSLLHAKEAV